MKAFFGNNKLKIFECISVILAFMLFIFYFADIFLLHKKMSIEDNYRSYPLFHYVAESLIHGFIPYWDPYNVTGVPFYYHNGLFNAYDPIVILVSFIGKLFTNSLLTLYLWKYAVMAIFSSIGLYVFSKEVFENRTTCFFVFFVFLFSSAVFTTFRQPSIALVDFATFWVFLFLFRLIKNFNLFNVIGLSLFTGWSFQGYSTVYSAFYLTLFVITLFIFNRKTIFPVFFRKRTIPYLMIYVCIALLFSLNILSIFLDTDKMVFTQSRRSSVMNYDIIIETGSHAGIWDFFGLFAPKFFSLFGCLHHGASNHNSFNMFSEDFLYIGLLPLALAVLGIISGRNEYKRNFLVLLVITGIIMLGHKTILHKIFYFSFPPLQLARHMHIFSGLFIFTLVYFVGLGLDHILCAKKTRPYLVLLITLAVFAIVCFAGLHNIESFDRRCDTLSINGNRITFSNLLSTIKASSVTFYLIAFGTISLAAGLKCFKLKRAVVFPLLLFIALLTDFYLIRNTVINNLTIDMPDFQFSESPTESRFSSIRHYASAEQDYFDEGVLMSGGVMRKDGSIYLYQTRPTVGLFMLKDYYRFVSSEMTHEVKSVIVGVKEDCNHTQTIKFYSNALFKKQEQIFDYLIKLNDKRRLYEIENTLFIDNSSGPYMDEPVGTEKAGTPQAPHDISYTIKRFNPNELTLEYTSSSDGFIYRAESYDEYWKGYLDSVEIPIYRAFVNYQAVRVSKGTHTLTFRYDPKYFKIALRLYFCAFIGSIIGMVIVFIKDRKEVIKNHDV